MIISVRGFEAGTTEAQIKERLQEFGVGVLKVTIEESVSDDRYLAIIDLDTDEAGCKYLVSRLNGKVWRGRMLAASTQLFMR